MTIDWRSKGFWSPDETWSAERIAEEQPSIFGGGFTWPLLVVRRAAVETNIATMAAYCRRHGVDFAPHAKTTMAPGLLDAQLRAGAWGMTVATPNQALVLRRLGVERVLIANEVLDPAALSWLARESGAGWEVYFQVDSVAGVEAAAVTGGPLRIFVELGHAGGRTGVRSLDELEAVAQAVAAAPGLELVGVTGYEGQLPDQAGVDAYLDRLVDGVERLAKAGLLAERPWVSAGGSAWFDRVIDRFGRLGPQVRVIVRSGASVTHDDGFYRERTPFVRVPEEGPLDAALEIWAQVVSAPEPGLAIAGMGKRDAPFDEGLPVPLEVRAAGGAVRPAAGVRVTKLNDHHTYLELDGAELIPGDLIRFGISHPCTAFDKWRDIPVVDEDRRVVDVLHTYF
ncbi:D-serine deaminase-like pyridoxal phosphate-dependent protein [Actinoplanes lutulentus]|uniref:D-serine deaminase-like pyridoxal phosphate-dependent protein n=1 Tax=Actinoplanes lutulentus TaxID=1287878 RepID=A0A327Z3A9_9ACTN|nr:alanine racemase [Actinoplanes lutulentus]MBB2942961.1 D-serine deaminase-like pyridoxal phosphate-dependent protein [Actinoplanes lutulentus]RAK26773.1 D-serine deaminase-like pyridoxal phosphate-dependent protein [Actinoplanes lutulentus]